MKLIVGLGNPGPKYALTRHNIGFLCLDAYAEAHGQKDWRSEHKALTLRMRVGNEQVCFAKPQTFMNLSGQSVVSLLGFYQIAKSDLLVVHDEVDIPFASMRFQEKRGHGGHNGIRNIHELLGGNDYARLKLGVGRPPTFVDDEGKKTRPTIDTADWVLQKFSKEEMNLLPDFISKSCDAIDTFVSAGLEKAMNRFNS